MATYFGTKGDDLIDTRAINITYGSNIYADSGNDIVYFGGFGGGTEGASGNDRLISLDGTSAVLYWNSPAGINANLETGIVFDGWGTTDHLTNIHCIAGSPFSDRIVGSQSNDIFNASSSSDIYDGGNGIDKIAYHEMNSGNVVITYDAQSDSFLIKKNNFEFDTIKNIEYIQFSDKGYYLNFLKTIIGSDQSERVQGSERDDVFLGGLGSDSVIASNGIDTIRYNVSGLADIAIKTVDIENTQITKRFINGLAETDYLNSVERVLFYKNDVLEKGYNLAPSKYSSELPKFRGFDWNDYGDDYYSNPIAQIEILNYLDGMASNTIKLDNSYEYNYENNSLISSRQYMEIDDRRSAADFFTKNGINIVYETYISGSDSGDNLFMKYPVFPNEKAEGFFNSYTQTIIKEARFAEEIGAEIFVFGAEMGDITSRFPEKWAQLISNIRQNFSGLITYGANFNMSQPVDLGVKGVYNSANEAVTLSFGHLLDFIGLDCYSATPLVEPGTTKIPSITDAYNAWDNSKGIGFSVIETMRSISEQFQKPLFIVENAWLSIPLSNNATQNERALPPSEEAQANLYHGEFLQFFSHLKDIIGGITIGGQFPDIKYNAYDYLLNGYSNADGTYGLSRAQGGQIGDKLAEKTIYDFFSGNIQNSGLTITLSPDKKYGFGYEGNDIIYDAYGEHFIDAAGGNDIIHAGAGDDQINGGAGIDLLLYSGAKADYTISRSATSVKVTSSGEQDTIQNIERLRFSDASLAFDTDGNAGQAYRLYRAALDRTPDQLGLSDWIHYMDNGGQLNAVSQMFIDSQEFRAKYGALDNFNFVNQLYRNVLDRDGETQGVNDWVGVLQSGAMTRAQVLVGFSESVENQGNVQGEIKNGIAFTEYWLV